MRRAIGLAIVLVLSATVGVALLRMFHTDHPPTPSDAIDTTRTVRLLALGDSLTTGVGSTTGGYVGRVQRGLGERDGVTVAVTNRSVPGQTSTELLSLLQRDGAARTAVREADIVAITTGGNDLLRARARYQAGRCGGVDGQDCLRQALMLFAENWRGIASSLREQKQGGRRVTMTLYNSLLAVDATRTSVHGNGPDGALFTKYLMEMNAIIGGNPEIAVVDGYGLFTGQAGGADPVARGLMSDDRIHPNERGYDFLAQAFLDQL